MPNPGQLLDAGRSTARKAPFLDSVQLCELLTFRPRRKATREALRRSIGLECWRLSDTDSPECASGGGNILRICNVFMTKQLSPGTVGSIAETAYAHGSGSINML